MRIRVDDPAARDRMAAALAAAGCEPLRIGRSLEIDCDETVATQVELAFFVRAWRRSHPEDAVETVGRPR